MKRHYLTGAALAVMLTISAGAAHAVTTDDLKTMHLEIVPCRAHNAAQESMDAALAGKAIDSMSKHDLPALDQMMPDLRAALNHAPDVRWQPELCDGKIILYTDDPTALFVLTGAVTGNNAQGAKSVEQRDGLPYGLLGFIVGWIEFEHKDYQAAVTDYAKGLSNDPDMASLESEYVLTLSQLGRNAESLAAIDAFLAAHPGLETSERANMLRKRGYVLVELGRLDDAEGAYKESLTLEPDNTLAKDELEYIKTQRASKAKT